MYAAINGYLDQIPVAKVADWEIGFQDYMETNHPDILKSIKDTKELSDDTETSLKKSIDEFNKNNKFE